MWKFAVLSLVLLMTSRDVFSQSCTPDNCKLPDCRCWNHATLPGGLDASDVPQMVVVSFEYGINTANVDRYLELFDGLANPNGCQPKATFFPTELNTDFTVIKSLYDSKHEIGMTTPTGAIPLDAAQWKKDFADMKAKIAGAGVPEASIKGTRGPELYSGGDEQFDSIKDNKLVYDSTCVSIEYMDKDSLLWPYTYDYIENTPECTIGKTVTKSYPGFWQFIVADLVFQGTKCASPSACSLQISDSQDAFDFFYNSFALHYEGKTKAPFILYIDPTWLTVEYQRQGTRQFLEFIRAAFQDTWIVTTQQALDWIQAPVPSANATDFDPWKC
ncbi:chitin deacetylase 9 [Elysia marginata]|uniref:Chitin deacetylase 9 n=1 Tax=Elysia marginata TaxID=1093978 RepID=A0AAV4HVV5_9GAST|nr:chitin deacetylase 9 [Elysia marginata]